MTGLIPVKRGSNTPYSAGVNRYFVSSSDSTALYVGDPVAIAGTNTETEGHYPTVTKATLTADNAWVGVVVAVLPVTDELKTSEPLKVPYRAASTDAYVLVADDPDQEYVIGEDTTGAAIVTGDIGNLGLVVAGSGGSTVYGTSSAVLDSSSFDSGTANGQVQLLGLVHRADFALGDAGALFRVRINPAQHQYATADTSV